MTCGVSSSSRKPRRIASTDGAFSISTVAAFTRLVRMLAMALRTSAGFSAMCDLRSVTPSARKRSSQTPTAEKSSSRIGTGDHSNSERYRTSCSFSLRCASSMLLRSDTTTPMNGSSPLPIENASTSTRTSVAVRAETGVVGTPRFAPSTSRMTAVALTLQNPSRRPGSSSGSRPSRSVALSFALMTLREPSTMSKGVRALVKNAENIDCTSTRLSVTDPPWLRPDCYRQRVSSTKGLASRLICCAVLIWVWEMNQNLGKGLALECGNPTALRRVPDRE